MNTNKPFDVFKEMMPSSAKFVEKYILELNTPHDKLKTNFSHYLDEIQNKIYVEYLSLEEQAFNKAIQDGLFGDKDSLSMEKLKSFFLSVSQSRKSRAGKVFELIIENLLKYLNYPIDTQKKIQNLKIDFILPSRKYYDIDPLGTILLSAKRTFRERWKQVVSEADQSNTFFLATIDKDITKIQLNEIQNSGIYVINTEKNINSIMHYKNSKNVISYEHFIDFHLDHQIKNWG